jgi:threonyl-tRNA synthetase
MLVVGDREAEARAVGLREHGKGDAGAVALHEFVERLSRESATRSA